MLEKILLLLIRIKGFIDFFYKNIAKKAWIEIVFPISGVKIVEWPPHKEIEDMEGKNINILLD